jgi:ABC-type Na+ efflux pump permease subunit
MSEKLSSPSGHEQHGSAALDRRSWVVILTGFGVTVVGFILMAGGASEDPEVFNPEVFSFRRITLAPILVLAGYVTGILGILIRRRASRS